MEQLYKSEEVLTATRSEEVIRRFEELKKTAIESATEYTIIRMDLIVGCGCGGSSESIFGVIEGNHKDLIDRYSDMYVDKDDLREMRQEYHDMHFYKGNLEEGVTDIFNPDEYEKIL